MLNIWNIRNIQNIWNIGNTWNTWNIGNIPYPISHTPYPIPHTPYPIYANGYKHRGMFFVKNDAFMGSPAKMTITIRTVSEFCAK